jgi:hypothetical protein
MIFVIEPILKLRGMDVFLADDTESCGVTWLISPGLADVPLVVNVIRRWGISSCTLKCGWVKDWNIVEEDECDDDVKALKRFLNGDSEYRNERLKIILSIVEAHWR